MHPHLFPTSFLIFMFLIFILILDTPRCVCADDEKFTTCRDQLFQCDGLANIGYPFSGGSRPAYCGHPGFNLSCQENVARLTIQSTTYRVLRIDDTAQTLTVARDDFWNNICPTYLRNATLDYNLFSYTSNTENLTLYYDCPLNPVQPQALPNQFSCTVNDTKSNSYYFPDSILASTCNNTIVVPIFTPSSASLNISAALNNGFGLRWQANDTYCDGCVQSGGRCGYDSNSFTCYCADQSYPSVCNSNQTGNGMCPAPN